VADPEKTEDPTPKKKRQARKDGNIPKSGDLSSWGGVLVATYVIPFVLASAVKTQRDLMMRMQFGISHPSEAAAKDMLAAGATGAATAIAPLLAAMVAVAISTNVAQTKGSTSFSRIKPKPSKLNPLKGAKRLVSPQSGYQALKVIVKAGVLLAVAWGPLINTTKQLATMGSADLMTTAPLVGVNALGLVRRVAWAGLLIGAFDYVVQRRKNRKSLKMTKQEVRDEARMSEGDPAVKAKVKQRMLQVSRNRMMAAVAKANVVIVNPIHVAVALVYEPGSGAPKVVAKGLGAVALQIRDEAMKHSVPVVKEIDLAWALHDVCELEQPVPPLLFEAVARVLAFVLTVGKRAAAYGYVQSLPGTEGQREPEAGSRPPRLRPGRRSRAA
jgi:flagellar biosynthesis protein FlhB